ncbi:ParD-like family protein [Desulfotignum phosphitoxidans]|uniref:ParD-like family protein n=1 Tax=Desulfotignum phosphitoxidans TaxID=190898 RepID=UPI001F4916AF|nr:ParD-like family protein [Desulfotignum phosphitoxidans]
MNVLHDLKETLDAEGIYEWQIVRRFNERWFQGWSATPEEQRIKFIHIADSIRAHPDFDQKYKNNQDTHNRVLAFQKIFEDVMLKKNTVYSKRNFKLQNAILCIISKRKIKRGNYIMATAVRITDELVKDAKIFSKIDKRSLTGQIEHWARIGKCAEENPDLTYDLIKEILIGIAELDYGETSEYKFG